MTCQKYFMIYNIQMNIPFIITGVIVVILLYILWIFFRNSGKKITQTQNLNNPVNTPIGSMNDTSTRFAYSVWVYVNSWNSNSAEKVLFERSTVQSTTDFTTKLFLDKTDPTLYLDIKQTCNNTTTATTPIVMTTNFPVQKWCHVAFSVDGQYVDCYIDGKLVKSILLNCSVTAPKATDGLYVGNSNFGNDIYLKGLYHWITPITPQEVWNKYLSGNGTNPLTSSFQTIGLGLAVFKNNVETGMYRLV